MKKCKIILAINDMLDEKFKICIEELIDTSGYYSVIERKDSKNWEEHISEDGKEYCIISYFTDEEIKMLKQQHYRIEYLETK